MTGNAAGPEPPWLQKLSRLADDSSSSTSWWTWIAAALVAAALAGAFFGRIGALAVIGVSVAVAIVRAGELIFEGNAGTVRALLGVAVGSAVALGLLAWAGGLPGADRPGADLRGQEIHTLSTQDLRGAQLSGARLEGLKLAGRDFSGVIAQGTSFRGSRLNDAVFRGADLHGADFTNACLRGADFSGASLDGVTLTGADVTGAVFPADASPGERSVRPARSSAATPRVSEASAHPSTPLPSRPSPVAVAACS